MATSEPLVLAIEVLGGLWIAKASDNLNDAAADRMAPRDDLTRPSVPDRLATRNHRPCGRFRGARFREG